MQGDTSISTGSSKPAAGYWEKIKGGRRTISLPVPPAVDLFVSWLGAFLGIGAVAGLSLVYHMPLLVLSFGASAVLIYGVPDVPLAQPRNVIGGHVIAAATGVCIYYFFGLTWWSAALATSLAIVLMLVTGTTHPPGGATALGAVLNRASPIYILTPVAAGAVIMVIIGLLVNNLSPHRRYPKYWL
ncbi:HPP family protein [Moorella sp. ACPs]|uniref:HPP family protein n=1 Tax=Neomoorella carbonis TaxID=3062783 RepID=UPI003255FF98